VTGVQTCALPISELEPWPPAAETAPPELASGELAWPELADTELADTELADTELTQGADEDKLAHPDPSGDELGGAELTVADAALTRDEPAAWNAANQVQPARLQTAVLEGRPADRFYPLRLLVIIVIAALIGSGLVLLFK
jgi:hypothetical protein